MTPLEEQLEKLARELNLEAGRQRGLSDVDDWDYITEQERGGWRNMAKTAIAVLLPLEVTDEMVEAGAKALGEWGGSAMPGPPLNRELSRACLSAALTQKGEPRACTGCANGCAGCKGKGKPYGEELMRQLRQGQKGDNE